MTPPTADLKGMALTTERIAEIIREEPQVDRRVLLAHRFAAALPEVMRSTFIRAATERCTCPRYNNADVPSHLGPSDYDPDCSEHGEAARTSA